MTATPEPEGPPWRLVCHNCRRRLPWQTAAVKGWCGCLSPDIRVHADSLCELCADPPGWGENQLDREE